MLKLLRITIFSGFWKVGRKLKELKLKQGREIILTLSHCT